ncbi:hypothetical protein [Halorubrum ezzemoulense]|uniref:hypothetical protein n=1 Tax=Halorubrum ezzemoulense TaxID=337243 RepID=UPI0015C668DC|nr:hypothetical protein [Halorubrum ezzemoulense]
MIKALLSLLTAIPTLLRLVILTVIIWGGALIAMGGALSATGPMPELWPIINEIISAL